jgi:hypothetical protein
MLTALGGREYRPVLSNGRAPLPQFLGDRRRQDHLVVMMAVPGLHLCPRDRPKGDRAIHIELGPSGGDHIAYPRGAKGTQPMRHTDCRREVRGFSAPQYIPELAPAEKCRAASRQRLGGQYLGDRSGRIIGAKPPRLRKPESTVDVMCCRILAAVSLTPRRRMASTTPATIWGVMSLTLSLPIRGKTSRSNACRDFW